MTTTDYRLEWEYLYAERLGIMIGDKESTPEDRRMASDCADAGIERLRKQESHDNNKQQD